MHIDFESLPDTSRIWIYQADRILNESEILLINNKLSEFVSEWNSHGTNLPASFSIKHNIFIIIAVNENDSSASGCSIDKSVNTIKSISDTLKVDFFNRNYIFILKNNTLEKSKLIDFKNDLKSGLISSETMFFDNTITTLYELKHNWLKKANESWLKNVLNLL
jgi:hypothetical protein